MPVPPVPSDHLPVPVQTAHRPAGPARAAVARLAALVLVALAGAACGQSDETVSPDIHLSEVATGQGVDALPADRTAASDAAAVRADTGGAADPSDALGGVAAAPPTVAPATAAPAAPAAPSTAAPAAPDTVAPAVTLATVAPTTVAPAPGAASATTPVPAAPLPTVAVSGSGAPAPTPTTVTTPVSAAESDLLAGEDRSFTLLNELRGGATLAPLTRDPALDTLAREWSRHMAETGELVHSQNPYGENIAFTSNASLTAAEAAAVFERLWSEDPGHSQNMMGAYVKVGVGVWKSDRGWYGTHLYNY